MREEVFFKIIETIVPLSITFYLLKQQLRRGRYCFQGKWEAPARVRGGWTPV